MSGHYPYMSLPGAVYAAADRTCQICHGDGWVCEEHPDRSFETGLPSDCQCSAGMPCACTGMK